MSRLQKASPPACWALAGVRDPSRCFLPKPEGHQSHSPLAGWDRAEARRPHAGQPILQSRSLRLHTIYLAGDGKGGAQGHSLSQPRP